MAYTGHGNASVGQWDFSAGQCRCPYNACQSVFRSLRSMVMHIAVRHPRVDGRPLSSVVHCPVENCRRRFPDMETMIQHIFAVHDVEARVIHLDACGSREYMRDEDDDPPPAAGEESTTVRPTRRASHRATGARNRNSSRQQSHRRQRNPTRNRNTRANEGYGTEQEAHDVMLTLQRRRGNAIHMYNDTMRTAMQQLRDIQGGESAGLRAFAPLLFDLFTRLQGRNAEGLGPSQTRTQHANVIIAMQDIIMYMQQT